MGELLRILDSPDPCSLLPLLGILYLLAHYVVRNDPKSREWGKRVAIGGFFAYCVYDVLQFGTRGADEWLWLAVRGLFAAGFVLVVAWIALPVTAALHRQTLSGPVKELSAFASANARRREERKREEQRQREYQESAPERARARQAATERAQQEVVQKRRRDDARVSCEVLYRLYQPDIKERFSPDAYDDFVRKYLGDNHPAEYVEDRAAQLQQLIQQHVEKTCPSPKFRSIKKLVAWHQDQRAQLEGIPDARLRASLLSRLHERYAELSTQIVQEDRG